MGDKIRRDVELVWSASASARLALALRWLGAEPPGRPVLVVAPSLEAALEVAEGDALRRAAAAIVVGGGADIYSRTIVMAARLEITRVHAQPQGDTLFPDIDPAQWRETARQEYAAGPDDDAPFTTLTYERRRG